MKQSLITTIILVLSIRVFCSTTFREDIHQNNTLIVSFEASSVRELTTTRTVDGIITNC